MAVLILLAGFIQLLWAYVTKQKRNSFIFGVAMLLWSVAVLILQYAARDFAELFAIFTIGMLIFGCSLIIIRKTFRCKEQRFARLIDYNYEYYRGSLRSFPVFEYDRNGQKEQVKVVQGFSKKRMEKHYQIGETYKLYCSEEDSRYCLLERRVQCLEVVMLIVGMLLMVFSVIMY